MSSWDSEAGAAAARLARSGLMALTGWPQGPPLLPPLGIVSALDVVVAAIAERTSELGCGLTLSWEHILVVRAAQLGLSRGGRRSANGSCCLLPAADGWVALNLARPDDLAAVDVLVGRSTGDDPWAALSRALASEAAAESVARARLLGIPAAVLPSPREHDGDESCRRSEDTSLACSQPATALQAWRAQRLWPAGPKHPLRELRVVDLSAMWAGPLVAKVLTLIGAEVTKVESTRRPDGSRANGPFYDWLHPAGQHELCLDFARDSDRQHLRALLEEADVVIEASRPRALEQLGCGPSQLTARRGRVWLSITGHGRSAPARDWVAFGDDAAVAAGLVAWDNGGSPVFCGDAIADPLAGLQGAWAVLEALASGGGALIDLAMSSCAARMGGSRSPVSSFGDVVDVRGQWWLALDGVSEPVLDPIVGG